MILIIGSHGFLGSKLSRSFIKKKYLIRKIDKNSKRISEKIDIRDYDALEKIFKKNKFQFVINCACEPATTRGKKKIFSTNFLGNKNLISLCEKYNIKKYIFFLHQPFGQKIISNLSGKALLLIRLNIMVYLKFWQKNQF